VRRLLLLLLPLLGTVAVMLLLLPRLPDRWDPFATLRVETPPGPFTRFKLRRLARDPEACFATLAAAGLTALPLPDGSAGPGCPLRATLRLAGPVPLDPPRPVVTCPLAVAWTIYGRHVLDPAAERHFGARIRQVRHLGTLACRDVRGGTRRSQHATANAIDLAGLRLSDGREGSVLHDWGRPGPAGAFLREARDGACRIFGAVLGPERDAAHRGHFHLDLGGWPICR